MLSGISRLPSSLSFEVESYLGVPIDLLAETDRRQPAGRVSRVLDLLEGMWSVQALKERHFDSWFTALISSHNEKVEIHYSIYIIVVYMIYLCAIIIGKRNPQETARGVPQPRRHVWCSSP